MKHLSQLEYKPRQVIIVWDWKTKKTIGKYDSVREASTATGVCEKMIGNCLTGAKYQSKGYGFRWHTVPQYWNRL